MNIFYRWTSRVWLDTPGIMTTPTAIHGPNDRFLLTVSEAASLLGIGRSTLYELVASGDVESVTIGRSRRVPVEAVATYVERLRSMSAERSGEE